MKIENTSALVDITNIEVTDRQYIKHVIIRNIKAIKELDMELDGKSVILSGENGAGKTTALLGVLYAITSGIPAKELLHSVNGEIEENGSFEYAFTNGEVFKCRLNSKGGISAIVSIPDKKKDVTGTNAIKWLKSKLPQMPNIAAFANATGDIERFDMLEKMLGIKGLLSEPNKRRTEVYKQRRIDKRELEVAVKKYNTLQNDADLYYNSIDMQPLNGLSFDEFKDNANKDLAKFEAEKVEKYNIAFAQSEKYKQAYDFATEKVEKENTKAVAEWQKSEKERRRTYDAFVLEQKKLKERSTLHNEAIINAIKTLSNVGLIEYFNFEAAKAHVENYPKAQGVAEFEPNEMPTKGEPDLSEANDINKKYQELKANYIKAKADFEAAKIKHNDIMLFCNTFETKLDLHGNMVKNVKAAKREVDELQIIVDDIEAKYASIIEEMKQIIAKNVDKTI